MRSDFGGYYGSVTERPQDPVEERERGRVAADELSWALRAVQRAGADVDRELARRLGLRALDYAALGHVMTADAPLGPVELSARLGISTGSGTELVDRLETAGHVERHRHPQDGRRLVLEAAAPAVGRILDELAPLLGALDELADGFTPQEREVVARYLRGAEQRLREYADER